MQKFTSKIGCRITVFTVFFFIINLSLNAQIKKSQQKISPDLLELAPESIQALSLKPLAKSKKAQKKPLLTPSPDLIQFKDGKVLIQAIAEKDAKTLNTKLAKIGLIKSGIYGRTVTGYLDRESILELISIKELLYATPVYKPVNNIGIALSNGDIALKSDDVKNKLGIDGSGSKIGVLSDSYNSLGGAESGIETGDLPGPANPNGYTSEIQILEDIKGGSDEGRGMMEIIHDVAPGAEIAFHTAFTGPAAFAEGILELAEAGCNIITDDVTYFNEPFYQDGIIAQSVDKAVRKYNVSYYSSAGNNARKSYESIFINSIDTVEVINPFQEKVLGKYILHDFNPGKGIDNFQKVTFLPGQELLYVFQWDEPFASAHKSSPGSTSDLDIFITIAEDAQMVILQSMYSNIGTDPIEILSAVNNGTDTVSAYIAIGKRVGVTGDNPDPGLIKYVNFGNNSIDEYHTNSSTCFGHSNSAKVQSIGASAWFFTPEFGVDPPKINYFSSVGGTPILFKPNGKKYWYPIIRRNPDFIATDGGNTTFFGQQINDGDNFPNFFGTSASAPHAAGVAALLSEIADNKARRGFLENCMTFTAIDMDDPLTPEFDYHYDFATGYGLLQADKAAELLIQFTIEPLSVSAVCSENPEDARNWIISNPNNYNVQVNWELFGSEQKDTINVAPGETTISTDAVPYFNLLLISWDAGICYNFDAAYSHGDICTSTKSAIASNNYDENLQVITQIYPNPVINDLNINVYTENNEKIFVEIYQSNGSVVFEEKIRTHSGLNTIKLDLQNIQSGVYLLNVINEEGKILKTTNIIKK